MRDVLDLTRVDNITLSTMLNALRTEHAALIDLYMKEKKAWSSLDEPSYLGTEQGTLLNNQCYEVGCVIEQLSGILNERRRKL